jgi:hypothetical protein
MAEKRKPNVTLLLRFEGNKGSNKIELFPASQFADKVRYPEKYLKCRYRIRSGGTWYQDKVGRRYSFFTKWEFRDLLWKAIPF